MSKKQLTEEVRKLMREVLKKRFEGTAYNKLSRAHGYADGYMCALMDAGLVQQDELLELVGAERMRFSENAA